MGRVNGINMISSVWMRRTAHVKPIAKARSKTKPIPSLNFAESIRRHIKPIGGVELKLGVREAVRRPPKFGE